MLQITSSGPLPHETTPALSVVIPVYNGATTIGALVAALAGLDIPGGIEIVLVNDGSPDDSDAVCRRLAATASVPVTYVEHARNYGEHNAVMTGLRHARGEYAITMDDDLQNPPEEVVRLFLHCRDGGYDVVYTSYAEKQHAAWRNLGSRFANRVADLLIDKPKGLYLSSFRCMSRLVIDGVTRYEGPFPYVDGLIMQVTQRIGTLEVRHLPRAQGRSNYTLRRLVRLWLNLAFNFSLLPLRLAVFLGLAMGAIGGIGALYVIAHALFGQPPEGWASTMVVVLLLSAAQFVILGIVGEYLGRTFQTGNRKPQGIVRAVVRATVPDHAR
ncbi:glycosyltransferase family 2 protein [Elioraea sp.]|uniref:glycosyltransferase family 2 protein n=1 Tax=Elioraea sp. TaxID=2185103 RepID=UPI00307F8CF4